MPRPEITVRAETAADFEAVRDVIIPAFDGDEEAELVRDLMEDRSAWPIFSFVAEREGAVVGHILFTAARVSGGHVDVVAAILAPLAVKPAHQRSGVGRALIEHGFESLKAASIPFVIVLGDPAYYERFGFKRAMPLGLLPPFELIPEYQDGWLVRNLDPDHTQITGGQVACADALSKTEYWRP